MHAQNASGLKTSGGSYQTGYGDLHSRLLHIAKHGTHHTPHGILGLASIHSLAHKFKEGKPLHNLLDKKAFLHIKDYLSKHKQSALGKITKEKVIDFVKRHEGTPLHVSDLFGSQMDKARELKKIILGQKGGSLWSKLKTGAKKAGHSIGRFLDGKTRVKPSDIASGLSKVASVMSTVASFIPDPRAKAVAVGLKTASKFLDPAAKALKKSGRGLKPFPKYILKHMDKNPTEVKKIIEHLREQRGTGIIPTAFTKRGLAMVKYFLRKPGELGRLIGLLNKKKKKKSAKPHSLLPVLPDYLSDPQTEESENDEPKDLVYGQLLDTAGRGLSTSGGSLRTAGRPRQSSGSDLVIGTRARVMKGTADVTRKGETRDMLTRNKQGRIVCKRRSEASKRAYARRKKHF